MSLKPDPITPIPEETIRIARAAFPKGNMFMWMRDELGAMFTDEQLADLFSERGQPAWFPWRLALVTIMQFVENLTDRQTADAVRGRIDWKYGLGLELDDPGFDFSILSEFRGRLLDQGAEARLFDAMLRRFVVRGWLKTGGRQRTDSTHVLGKLRLLNQLELVGETLRYALNTLATVAPDWLRPRIGAEWFDRYSQPIDDYRLPQDKKERDELALVIGQDGITLMEHIYHADSPEWLRYLPPIETLRRVWVEQFYFYEGELRWRTDDKGPPTGQRICTPYEPEARYGFKRGTRWIGYKAHFSETCEEDVPNLITHVETTVGSIADVNALEDIHQGLATRGRLPKEHILDAGYVSSDTLVASQREHDMDLIGPVRPDNSWQAKESTGYDITQFTVDWDNERVICPQGKTSVRWKYGKGKRYKPNILAEFRDADCQACPARELCTRSSSGRNITLQRREEFEALQAARKRQQQADYQEVYAKRAAIEGTISQAAFTLGLRRARYRGEAKVHLEHLMTAAGINLSRVYHWANGIQCAKTHVSAFARMVA
jgi:transposase